MLRALLISIALHLAVLLSPALPEGAERQCCSSEMTLLMGSLRQSPSAGEAFVAQDSSLAPQGTLFSSGGGRHSALRNKSKSSVEQHPASPPIAASPVSSLQGGHDAGAAILAEAQALASEGALEYRLNVAREARKFKRYPLIARESGWEGVVVVAVSMALVSARPVVSLERSSGYDALDRQALEMMAEAVTLAPLPVGMQGRKFGISLPVEYRLAE